MFDLLSDITAPFYSKVSPKLAAGVTFAASFGGIMFTRIVIEKELYLLRWWSFRLGDSISFPLIVHSAIVLWFVADGVKLSEKAYPTLGLTIFVLALAYDMFLLESRKDPGR